MPEEKPRDSSELFEEILGKVIKITSRELNVEKEKIRLDSRFKKDFNADSLDLINLVMYLEDEYKLAGMPNKDMKKIETVGHLTHYIFSARYHHNIY